MNPALRSGARAAVFFDRDGTLIREVEGALSRPSQLEFLPGAAAAVRRVNQARWAAVVITNQSAIARGWMTPFELERVHAAMSDRLRSEGGLLDAVLHCPHLDADGIAPYRRSCECRKPRPGLLFRAAGLLDVDLRRSWLIGDALRDLAAAAAVGARSILVLTGKGVSEARRLSELPLAAQPVAVTAGVLEAVELALATPASAAAQGR